MTQTQEKAADLLATDRAEQTLTRAGKQLGRLAGQATLRLRQATQAFREEADQLDTPTSARQESKKPTTSHVQASQLTLQRAETLVDQFGLRISHWASGGNLSMQRTVARLREDAEDMWIEAREMHKEWQGKHVHGENEAD